MVADVPGVEPERWVENLTPFVKGLSDKMKQMSEVRRDVERKLDAKTIAIENYDESLLRSSQLLEAMYKVSGNERMAAKLRKTARRVLGEPEPPETGEGEGEGKGEGDAGGEESAPAAPAPDQAATDPKAEEPDSREADAAEPKAAPDRPPAQPRAAEPPVEA